MTTVGDHANTPEWVLDRVREVDHIAFDPCSNPTSIVNAAQSIQLPGDGLLVNWIDYCRGNGLAFVNPPYSRGQLVKWANKCNAEADRDCQIIALVPCDPSTKWFRRFVLGADACVILNQRLRFGGHGYAAKGAHAVFYFGERVKRFRVAFATLGFSVECYGNTWGALSEIGDIVWDADEAAE